MKDKFRIFISTFIIRTPNKLQNNKNFWVVFNEFQGHKVNNIK